MLQGKIIGITGTIELYQGKPEIEVTSMVQIKGTDSELGAINYTCGLRPAQRKSTLIDQISTAMVSASLTGTDLLGKKFSARTYFASIPQSSAAELKIPTEPFQSRRRPVLATGKPPRLALKPIFETKTL